MVSIPMPKLTWKSTAIGFSIVVVIFLVVYFAGDSATKTTTVKPVPANRRRRAVDRRAKRRVVKRVPKPASTNEDVSKAQPRKQPRTNNKDSRLSHAVAKKTEVDFTDWKMKSINRSKRPSGLTEKSSMRGDLKSSKYSACASGEKLCGATGQCIKKDATCSQNRLGSDTDAHGCKASAGYTWCAILNKCARPSDCPKSDCNCGK